MGKESLRKPTDHFAESRRFPWPGFPASCIVGVPIICQQRLLRSEPVLKNNQALVIQIRATEVDLLCSCCFAFFNEPPEQERHTAEFVESRIRTSILIDDA